MFYKSEVEIGSIGKYLEEIIRLRRIMSNDIHGEYLQWYRGHAVASWELIPKIQRDFLGTDEELFRKERYYTNDYQARASLLQLSKPALSEYSNWLTLMQHYGLPTRLLDWSRSPLVALYFAVSDKKFYKKDACIWILTPGKLNQKEKLEKPSKIDGREYENSFIYNMSHNTIHTMIYNAFRRWDLSDDDNANTPEDMKFEHRYRTLSDKIACCYPTEADGRVYNQHATFTVHNSSKKLIDVCDHYTLASVTIPSNVKAKLIYELKICGITQSYIYPDFEHLANELRELHRKKKWRLVGGSILK